MAPKIALLPKATASLSTQNEAQLAPEYYKFLKDLERSAGAFEDLFIRPVQFGAIGDGAADDDAAFLQMFDKVSDQSGGYIIFAPGKIYRLDLSALASGFFWYEPANINGIHIDGMGSEIEFDATFADGEAGFWFVGRTLGFVVIENLFMVAETGIDSTGVNPKGLQTFYFSHGSGEIIWRNIIQSGGRAGLWAHYTNSPAPPRNKRVIVDNYTTENTFYPLSIQNTDYASVRNYFTTNAGRSLFLENAQNVTVEMASKDPILDDVILAAANWPAIFSGTELTNISIKYQRRDTAGGSNSMAMLARTDTVTHSPVTIRNIEMEVDIEGGQNVLILMRQIEGAGTVDSGAARGHVVDGVRLRGVAKGMTNSTGINFSSPSFGGEFKAGDVIRNVEIGPFYGETLDGTSFLFNIDGAAFLTPLIVRDVRIAGNINLTNFAAGMVKLYNCQFNDYSTDSPAVAATWSQLSGTPPALGNGTLTCQYFRDGSRVSLNILLVMGSTTTFGDASDFWVFRLPAPYDTPPRENATGAVYSVAGATDKMGVCWMNAGTLDILIKSDAGGWMATNPAVWAAGDFLQFTISYDV